MNIGSVLTQFFDCIKIFVSMLFTTQIAPGGITLGSMILLSLLFFVLVTNFWPRD